MSHQELNQHLRDTAQNYRSQSIDEEYHHIASIKKSIANQSDIIKSPQNKSYKSIIYYAGFCAAAVLLFGIISRPSNVNDNTQSLGHAQIAQNTNSNKNTSFTLSLAINTLQITEQLPQALTKQEEQSMGILDNEWDALQNDAKVAGDLLVDIISGLASSVNPKSSGT